MPNPGLEPRIEEQVKAALLAGMKPTQIVGMYEVSHSTVSRIKARLPSETLEKMKTADIETIVDLTMIQLETGIEAAIAIAGQAHDKEWRDKQKANELSTFYGVITDKNIRLLEASENAHLASLARQSVEYQPTTDTVQ